MALRDIFKKKDKPNVSVWFLFIASAVILIFFLWYFLIYVKGNEKLLIQKSFRVLTNIGDNFKEREKDFRGIAESEDMKGRLHNYWSSDYSKENFGNYYDLFIEQSFYKQSFEDAKKKIKDLYSHIEIDKDSRNKKYFYFSKDYKFISDSLVLGKDTCSVVLGKDTCSVRDTTLNIHFKINKKDFFEPIERKDAFDELSKRKVSLEWSAAGVVAAGVAGVFIGRETK